jgi:hypothetical protein
MAAKDGPHGYLAKLQDHWRAVWLDATVTSDGAPPKYAYRCHNGERVPTEGRWWMPASTQAAALDLTWLSPLAVPSSATQLLADLDGDGYESGLEDDFQEAATPLAAPPVSTTTLERLANQLCRQHLRSDGTGPSEREIVDQAIAEGAPLAPVADQFLELDVGREMWISADAAFTIQVDTGQITDPAPPPVGPPQFSGPVTYTPGYLAPGHTWP